MSDKIETRKIILKKGEPAQSFWLNENFAATPGAAIDAPVKQALMAMDTGAFEYVEIDAPAIEIPDADALPLDFPHSEVLIRNGITTLSELNLTADEILLKIKGVGDQSLKQIREAAALGFTEVTGEN